MRDKAKDEKELNEAIKNGSVAWAGVNIPEFVAEQRGASKTKTTHTPAPWELEYDGCQNLIHKHGHMIAEIKEMPIIGASGDYDRQKEENDLLRMTTDVIQKATQKDKQK